MSKLFLNLKKFSKQIALIENNKKYKYSFLINQSDELKKKIEDKSLILMIGSNQLASIIGYITFLKGNYCTILLDESFDDKYIKNICKIYKPNYVFGKKEKISMNFNFKNIFQIKNFILVKTNFNKNFKLNLKNSLLISTSGTTNDPKLIRLSSYNIYDNTKKIIDYLKIKYNHTTITTMPFGYSYGLSIINTHLETGATIIINEKTVFEKEFWKTLKKFKVYSFGGVPSFYELLFKLKFKKLITPYLKYITQAGGKIDEKLCEYFSNIKNLKFISMYGQAEASPRISYLGSNYNKVKLGSIGKPLKGYKLNIDKMGKFKNYDYGELIFKGKNVCLGYASNIKDLFKGDINKGMLKTGDIGYKDKDNFYYIIGRKKRISKIFGIRINLDDVEDLLKKNNFLCHCIPDNKFLIIEFLQNYEENQIKNIIFKEFKIKINFIKTFRVKSFSKNSLFK
tara:strand:- start:1313 stop:2674 length:1362 start_codon:yes stop_codon:yes gene_type:complete